jgi:signal peptide peptidase SppA
MMQFMLIKQGYDVRQLERSESKSKMMIHAFAANSEVFVRTGAFTGYKIKNGVAVIPLHGALYANNNGYGDSYPEFVAMLDHANSNAAVQKIVLDINSPGGQVLGLPNAVDAVANSKKTVFSFATGLMSSAAYAIGSQAKKIASLKQVETAIGSIGVIMTHFDMSKMYQDGNIDITVIKSGDKKDAGSPYRPITDSEKLEFQNEIDSIMSWFTDVVYQKRPTSKQKLIDMQAAVYNTADAIKNKLIDVEVDSFESALSYFNESAGVNASQGINLGAKMEMISQEQAQGMVAEAKASVTAEFERKTAEAVLSAKDESKKDGMLELASFLASDECAGKTQAALAMIKDGLSLSTAKTALRHVNAEVAPQQQGIVQVLSGATAEPLKSVERPEGEALNASDAAMQKILGGTK